MPTDANSAAAATKPTTLLRIVLLGVVEAITAQAARFVYLPPYSLDLNSIEQAFAKFKAPLRRAAERTRDGLWQAIGHILDRYQPQECQNFFKNVGYAI